MEAIQRLLTFLYQNWVTILVCIGIIVGLVQKTIHFFSYSKEERYAIAKKQISEAMLGMVTSAELDFADWNAAGSIKRSQVIDAIYKQYPILSKIVNQEDLIAWIDSEIDGALATLRDVIEQNEDVEGDSEDVAEATSEDYPVSAVEE